MVAKTKKTIKIKKTGRKFSSRHVVKRRGHVEPFDERKIYASVYEACHATQLSTKQAEKMAASVTLTIQKWAEKKDHLNAHEIHQVVVKALKKHHADTAYMYEHHKNMC